MKEPTYSLAELAERIGADLVGEAETEVTGLATIDRAEPHQVTFLANSAYARWLPDTRAAAVVLSADHAESCPVNALVMDNPYLGYAKLSHLFDRTPHPATGVHPTAQVAESAQVAPDASIGPNAVIAEGACIGAGVIVEAGCFVGAFSSIGADSRLYPNVTVYHDVTIGARTIIHASSVIGSDGFGFANAGGHWHKIAQIGGVKIGDEVEIGSCTSIDRGALGDTCIGNNVKIDDQVQIAHNVQIGDHSALAGCVGIAGSTKVGRYCTLGGGVGLSGHLELVDNVHVTGMSLVTNSISEPGVYSSGTGSMPNAQWRKNAVRFKQLDDLAKRLRRLEKDL